MRLFLSSTPRTLTRDGVGDDALVDLDAVKARSLYHTQVFLWMLLISKNKQEIMKTV